MITKTDSYILECDVCKEHYENHQGFSVFTDKEAAITDSKEDEWHEHGEKHFCPKCHTIDEDGNLIYKVKDGL